MQLPLLVAGCVWPELCRRGCVHSQVPHPSLHAAAHCLHLMQAWLYMQSSWGWAAMHDRAHSSYVCEDACGLAHIVCPSRAPWDL